MGIKQIETELFIEYLISLGLVYERHKASHYVFDNPKGKPKLDRPIIVRTKHKEIPVLHIHTNLKTLGLSHKDFEAWLKQPTKFKKKTKPKTENGNQTDV